MKKFGILAFLLFVFTMKDVQAVALQKGDVFTGEFDLPYNVTGHHVLKVEEDTRLTFTLENVTDDYIVSLSDNKKGVFATFSTREHDGFEKKGVHSLNVKKGTYDVTVSGYGYENGQKGNYSVTYETSPITGTDVEPNNDILDANPYTLGGTYRGEMYGDRTAYDKDIYKVEIPTFGKMTLHGQSGDGTGVNRFGFNIEVLNASKVEMFTFRNIRDSDELQVLLQPGTYYFAFSTYTSDKEINDYTFSTIFEPLDKNVWESGLNLDEARADVLHNNKTYNGFLYDAGVRYGQSNDYYKFKLVKDSNVTFIANAQKSLGALIFSDEKGSQLKTGGYATSETRKIIAARELKAGTYYVRYIPAFGIKRYEGYDLTMRIERFTDIPATHPFYEQIESLAQAGINKGYGDGKFQPNEAIKRKHVFVFLSRIEGLKLSKIRNMRTFKDLQVTHPDYEPVKAFYEAGIVDGSGSYINPESNLTRGQMAKILVNTFDLKMKGNGIEFRDVNPANGFYNYIQILASNGITVGSNGEFMPNEPVTRQHFSIFLHRTLQR